MGRLRDWLLPTPEQQASRRINQEIKQREKFRKDSARLGYELASLRRQDLLTRRQEEIMRTRGRIQGRQERIERSRASAPQGADPLQNLDALDKRLKKLGFG